MKLPRTKLKQAYTKSNLPGLLQKLYNADFSHLAFSNWFSNESRQILSNAKLNRMKIHWVM